MEICRRLISFVTETAKLSANYQPGSLRDTFKKMKQAIDRIFDKNCLSSVHLRIQKCCAKFIKSQYIYTSKEIAAISMVSCSVSLRVS